MSTQYVQYPQGGSGSAATGSSTGVPYALGPIDSAPANANGGFIGSFSFYQQSAGPVFPGIISSAAQTLQGTKTFLQTVSVAGVVSSGTVQGDAVNATTSMDTPLLTGANFQASANITAGDSIVCSNTLQANAVRATGLQNSPVRSLGSQLSNGSISLTTEVSGRLPEANVASTSAAYNVGTLDAAVTKSANGAVIGTSTLFMQSATNANPGIVSSAIQSFSGVKSFERIGANNTSGSSTVWITTSSASLTDPSLTIKAIPSQTGDLFQIFDSSNSPQAIFDSGGNFKFFHNTLNTSRFDVRPSINTSSINSGTAARYTAFFSHSGTQAVGVGGGLALGGPNNVGTNTTYGCVWVTKDNGVAGDVAASMHFATKNNGTGNFQRCLDFDAGGNATFAGTIAITGSVASKVTIGMPASNTPYTLTLPVSQGSNSWVLQNDGTGILSWASSLTNPMTTSADIVIGSASGAPARLPVGTSGQVLTVSSGATNLAWTAPATNSYFNGYTGSAIWTTGQTTFADPIVIGTASLVTRVSAGIQVSQISAGNLPGIVYQPASTTAVYRITMTFQGIATTIGANLSWKMTDGAELAIGKVNQGTDGQAVGGAAWIVLDGISAPATTNSVTVKIQGSASTGSNSWGSGTQLGRPLQITIVRIV